MRTDTDLLPETKLSSVRKGRRDIGIDTSRIHTTLELPNDLFILANYTLTMLRTLTSDMRQGILKRVNRTDTHLIIQELRTIAFFRSYLQQFRRIMA